MTTQLIREMMKLTTASGIDPTELQWFDITGCPLDQQSVDASVLRDYRPPFDQCMVLWQGRSKSHALYELAMTIKGTDPEEGIVVSVYKGPRGAMPRKLPLLVYVADGDVVRYGPADDGEVIDQVDAEFTLAATAAWLSLLSRGCDAFIPEVRDTFTNKRKIAEGKTPTYDWRTVRIEPVKPRGEHKGGTHARPRQHDRRGHLRRLKSGKTCWVKSCKVGDPTKGAVFHDYEVKA